MTVGRIDEIGMLRNPHFLNSGKSLTDRKEERNAEEVDEVVDSDEAEVGVAEETVIEEALTDLETDILTDEVGVTKLA